MVISQQPAPINSAGLNFPLPQVSTDQAAANVVNQAMSLHVQSISGDKAVGKTKGDKSY